MVSRLISLHSHSLDGTIDMEFWEKRKILDDLLEETSKRINGKKRPKRRRPRVHIPSDSSTTSVECFNGGLVYFPEDKPKRKKVNHQQEYRSTVFKVCEWMFFSNIKISYLYRSIF